jgi:hypothetical protein
MKIEVKNIWKPVTMTHRIETEEELNTLVKSIGKSNYEKADERVFTALSSILDVQRHFPIDLEFTFDSFEELEDLTRTLGETYGSNVGFDFYMELCELYERYEGFKV